MPDDITKIRPRVATAAFDRFGFSFLLLETLRSVATREYLLWY